MARVAKLVQSYATPITHSCGSKRAVFCHIILKTNKQSSFSIGSINNKIYNALNSTRTANFNPRPAVTTYLH